jgi:hypothetical protein
VVRETHSRTHVYFVCMSLARPKISSESSQVDLTSLFDFRDGVRQRVRPVPSWRQLSRRPTERKLFCWQAATTASLHPRIVRREDKRGSTVLKHDESSKRRQPPHEEASAPDRPGAPPTAAGFPALAVGAAAASTGTFCACLAIRYHQVNPPTYGWGIYASPRNDDDPPHVFFG